MQLVSNCQLEEGTTTLNLATYLVVRSFLFGSDPGATFQSKVTSKLNLALDCNCDTADYVLTTKETGHMHEVIRDKDLKNQYILWT